MLGEQIIVCIHLVMKTKQINKLHLNTALFKQIQDPTYQKNLHCYGNFYVAFLWKTRMEERKMECQLVALFFFKFCYVPRCTASNVPVKSKLQHPPPGQPHGHLNFWKIFVQIPPSRSRKAVQMAHHRSIPGDQMPPPPGTFR